MPTIAEVMQELFGNVTGGASSTTNPSISEELRQRMNRQPRMSLEQRGFRDYAPPEGRGRGSLQFETEPVPRAMVPISRRR